MGIKDAFERKKNIKEVTNRIYEGMKPLINATKADKIARDEKRIYGYFRAIQDDLTLIKDVSIVDDILGSRVFVQFQDRDNNFFTKKFSYEKLMADISQKEEENVRLYGKVIDHYHEFLNHIYTTVSHGLNVTAAMSLMGDITEVKDNYEKLEHLKDVGYYNIKSQDLEELDEAILRIAKKRGIEFENEEVLETASIRELFDKDVLKSRDGRFIIAATDYLRDKSEENKALRNYTKFSELTIEKKSKIGYYELLFYKLIDYQFSLSRKAMTGEMLNKLMVESSQKEKREEDSLMEKVLNGEELKSADYIDLAFMDINYDEMDIYTLLKSYTMDDINKRLNVCNILLDRDPKRKALHEKNINVLSKWAKLIELFGKRDSYISFSLKCFAKDLFFLHIDDVKKYLVSYQDSDNCSETTEKFDYQYISMLRKIIEFIDDEYLDDEKNLLPEVRRVVDEYLRVIDKNEFLMKISKTLDEFKTSNPKDVFDYKRLVEAWYDSYSKKAVPEDGSGSGHDLRRVVDSQVAKLESNMAQEVIDMIREDKLEIPKKYIK